MGSWRHAKQLADSGERVDGMIALETLGYFSDTPGSQKFPFPFGLVYPDRGNFIAFVGLPGSRAFTHRVTRAFRRSSEFPSIGGVAPLAHSAAPLTLIDRELLRFDVVWAAAGHPNGVFALQPAQLEALTGGAPVVDVVQAT